MGKGRKSRGGGGGAQPTSKSGSMELPRRAKYIGYKELQSYPASVFTFWSLRSRLDCVSMCACMRVCMIAYYYV